MNPKLKQTRARSEDKKEEQFERILEAGKNLFLEKGTEGFSMRNLAEMLGMTKNNLYNYIESKRELWISRDEVKEGSLKILESILKKWNKLNIFKNFSNKIGTRVIVYTKKMIIYV